MILGYLVSSAGIYAAAAWYSSWGGGGELEKKKAVTGFNPVTSKLGCAEPGRPCAPLRDRRFAPRAAAWQGSSDSNRGPSVLETDALTS